MSKEQIKSARNIEQHGEGLSRADELVLYRHVQVIGTYLHLDPAQQATRLEHEREQHEQAIGDLAARRQSLTEQAGGLGWRQRHEREHLRAAAASQEQYLARHQADIERGDLVSRAVNSL